MLLFGAALILASGLREASPTQAIQGRLHWSSLHLPHWSAQTHPRAWLLYQRLHQHGGRSSQQGHRKTPASGPSSRIFGATSQSPRCLLDLIHTGRRSLLTLYLGSKIISHSSCISYSCHTANLVLTKLQHGLHTVPEVLLHFRKPQDWPEVSPNIGLISLISSSAQIAWPVPARTWMIDQSCESEEH